MSRQVRNLSEKAKKEEVEKKIQYKLNSIKTDFESSKIKSFEHLFALIGPSVWARLMHMGYDTFVNKSKNPGDFSNNELIHLAQLVDTDINIILKFIFSIMKYKNKFIDGESIRI